MIGIHLHVAWALNNMKYLPFLFSLLGLAACQSLNITLQHGSQLETVVTVATFNVSMEANNYVSDVIRGSDNQALRGSQLLIQLLADGQHPQIRNIAEIIQHTRPDIILLNEFDHIDNPKLGVQAFINQYLAVSQQGAKPINYPYMFIAPPNTGLASGFDLDNDGQVTPFGGDAYGYGEYYGQYGMVLLSRYPIEHQQVRTFANFLWSDMPAAIQPIDPKTQVAFYTPQEWLSLRLSSKSHWDIPVNINGKRLHLLASHPTPPVFDGPADRNGARNHDEVRFWYDYINAEQGDYIYDDRGVKGGLAADEYFVILGDLNVAVTGSDGRTAAINALLNSPRVNQELIPASRGGAQSRPDEAGAAYHTASWGMRADYVIPSRHLELVDSGVFWPASSSQWYRLVKDRASSSDHRLVWVQLTIP